MIDQEARRRLLDAQNQADAAAATKTTAISRISPIF